MTFDFLGLKVARTRGNFEINFRLSNHNVPPGSSDYIYTTRPKAEFDGTGWTGGRTGYQKCPLIFFILFTHIDKVYI